MSTIKTTPKDTLRVISFIKAQPAPVTKETIMASTGLLDIEVTRILRSMLNRVEILRHSRGLYSYNFEYMPAAKGRPLKSAMNITAREASARICSVCKESMTGRVIRISEPESALETEPPSAIKKIADGKYADKLSLLRLIQNGKSIYSENPLIKSMIEDYNQLVNPRRGRTDVK